MSRVERFNNPATLDSTRIDALIAAGDRPIVQFTAPPPDALLEVLNAVCARHGGALDVRFYGASTSAFDVRLLRQLPAVASLTIDCLDEVTYVEELGALGHLEALSLGVLRLDAPEILAMPNLRGLKRLGIGPTKRRTIDLAPVAQMPGLVELTVAEQETGIASIGACSRLETLRLSSIGRQVRLGFIAGLPRLRSLRLLLGGRDDIDEVSHPGLVDLEITRIRGFKRLEPARFPSLERLKIADQIQLDALEFDTVCSKLESLTLWNCNKLDRLDGLQQLASLRELRLGPTAVDLDALLRGGLPPALRTFVFYTGRSRQDAQIRARLDGLGYSET